MIDEELMGEVRAYVASNQSLDECLGEVAANFVEDLGGRYQRSPNAAWWWQDLSTPSERVHYGDEDAILLILAKLDKSQPARLVITDDEAQPWPVVAGSVGELLKLVLDQRYFEYMLAAVDGSWIVFDTHHNELVFAGEFAGNVPSLNEF